jgi:hypothetical protein
VDKVRGTSGFSGANATVGGGEAQRGDFPRNAGGSGGISFRIADLGASGAGAGDLELTNGNQRRKGSSLTLWIPSHSAKN